MSVVRHIYICERLQNPLVCPQLNPVCVNNEEVYCSWALSTKYTITKMVFGHLHLIKAHREKIHSTRIIFTEL